MNISLWHMDGRGTGWKRKMDKQTHLYVVAYPTAKLSCWDGLSYCSSALLTGCCWRTSVPGWAQIYNVIGLLCMYTHPHTHRGREPSATECQTLLYTPKDSDEMKEAEKEGERGEGGRGTCASWINVITTPTTNQLLYPVTEEIYLCESASISLTNTFK